MTLSSRARTVDIYLPPVELLPRAYAEAIMPATVMNRDDEEVAFAALVTADGYLEDVKFIGDRIEGRRSLPTHAQLSESAQRRRDRALRTRPRRRRARLAECRLAGLAHDRARAPARLRPRARRRLEDALATLTKRKTNITRSVAARSLSFFVTWGHPRAVAELFFAS